MVGVVVVVVVLASKEISRLFPPSEVLKRKMCVSGNSLILGVHGFIHVFTVSLNVLLCMLKLWGFSGSHPSPSCHLSTASSVSSIPPVSLFIYYVPPILSFFFLIVGVFSYTASTFLPPVSCLFLVQYTTCKFNTYLINAISAVFLDSLKKNTKSITWITAALFSLKPTKAQTFRLSLLYFLHYIDLNDL